MINFGLTGIADVLQFGKLGGWIKHFTDYFGFYQSDGTTLKRVQAATGVENDDVVTFRQLNLIDSPALKVFSYLNFS
jgi:hypothetical protein